MNIINPYRFAGGAYSHVLTALFNCTVDGNEMTFGSAWSQAYVSSIAANDMKAYEFVVPNVINNFNGGCGQRDDINTITGGNSYYAAGQWYLNIFRLKRLAATHYSSAVKPVGTLGGLDHSVTWRIHINGVLEFTSLSDNNEMVYQRIYTQNSGIILGHAI